jgi:hypothetical protein
MKGELWVAARTAADLVTPTRRPGKFAQRRLYSKRWLTRLRLRLIVRKLEGGL